MMATGRWDSRGRARAALALLAMLSGACTASLGEDCRSDSSACAGGYYCCTEGKCGRGMCTTGCASDRDCPAGGYCESRICWLPCASDRDCPEHLQCKRKDGKLMCRAD